MPSPSLARRSLFAAAGSFLLLLILLAWLSSLGGPHDIKDGLVSVLYILITAAPPALAYLIGAIGLGSLFVRFTRTADAPHAIQSALGLALMLSLSHLLGILGLLKGTTGFILGGAPILLGIILLARRIMRHVAAKGEVAGRIPAQVLAGIPALALLLVAACSPPGWLWESEARGYDVLEYHLRLPQEWIAAGRIRPVDHNVYSYLPGYIESAFVHVAAITRAPVDAGPGRAMGLLVGEGFGVISCQILVVGTTLLAAAFVGRLAAALTSRWIGALAGTTFLSIPWVIVTGSMAYNEAAMLALFAAGLLAAIDSGLSLLNRGLISGFLVGVACGCKPTALFLCAPVVGVALIGISRRGAESAEQGSGSPETHAAGEAERIRVSIRVHLCHLWLLLSASAAGLIAILPWLVRNYLACGNPVFPMASRLFGNGHWTADQISRYITGHAFNGSIAARAAMLLDQGSKSELPRGFLHPQWAIFPVILILSAIAAIIRKRTRPVAILLSIGLAAQLLAWMFFTHLQSRFLLPIAISGCALFALGLCALVPRAKGGADSAETPVLRALKATATLIPIALAGMSIGTFKAQNGELPNLTLLESPWFRTGELDRAALKSLPADQHQDLIARMSPESFLSNLAPPNATTYLLGSATPLYFSNPILYNTTWDPWPLAESMRKHPGDFAAWTRNLQSRGIHLIFFDPAEIERLTRSGWIDPIITVDGARAWLQGQARLIRSWRQLELWELTPVPPP